MTKDELMNLQKYLQAKFGNPQLQVRARPKKDDSAEVYLGEEFIGVLYLDEDEGERSFNFQMAILDIDLEEVTG
ncbi:uncharacterized protein DUF3126 [Maritalea mobilis]|uniref:Uncharacterized protein DUF3126 n=1 Tax=Maritalea mobilis TaxID=483324 RepID=A0A4V3DBH5_9HYPH|nr:DUF3126 family protein [Maritalea mobilis]TDQ66588.1 uncharacterized protein DUF3126 [Maritalea mobilis]